MPAPVGACPLSQRDLIEGFFMEHRAQIIDIAAYLDRLDRSVERDAESDFRFLAIRKAMRELSSDEPGRVERILMHLSDPVVALMDTRDRQNAFGAPLTPTLSPQGRGEGEGFPGSETRR